MTTTIHRKKLLPILVMLFALTGLSLSVVGEAFSHGLAELTDHWKQDLNGHANSQDGHGHTHDFDEEQETASLHHDAGNHTHETVDQLKAPFVSRSLTVFRQPVPFAGGSPRSLRYRLERPPKASIPA